MNLYTSTGFILGETKLQLICDRNMNVEAIKCHKMGKKEFFIPGKFVLHFSNKFFVPLCSAASPFSKSV